MGYDIYDLLDGGEFKRLDEPPFLDKPAARVEVCSKAMNRIDSQDAYLG
jgi:hypothetical protein